VGFIEGGSAGALATASLFILPSFVVVLAVAAIYVPNQGLSIVQSLFYGIAPAVMAVIAVAAVKLARLTDKRDPKLWTITLGIGVVTAVTGAEVALLFIGAGLMMMLLEVPPRFRGLTARRRRKPPPSAMGLLGAGSSFKVLTGVAMGGTLVALGLFFLKAGAFIFGSGLAIVPFLREGVVNQHHWLTERQFLDAVAIGLISLVRW